MAALIAAEPVGADQVFGADRLCSGDILAPGDIHQDIPLLYTPVLPTADDSISIAVVGGFGSNAYGFARRQVRITGDTAHVEIDIKYTPGPSMPSVVPWRVNACLPPRPPGPLVIEATITTERPSGEPGVARQSRVTQVVENTGAPSVLGLSWLGEAENPQLRGGARPGSRYWVAVNAADGWDGSRALLQFSHDPDALSLDDLSLAAINGCAASLIGGDAGSTTLEIVCGDAVSDATVASFEVAVLEGFRGCADIALETVSYGQEASTPGTIIRVTDIPVGLAAAMDFSGNGEVDMDDLFIFADSFGRSDSPYDFDGDGSVDFDDFFRFADHFGKATDGT